MIGKQWLQWNKTTRQWSPERNVPKWRQQPVTNLVFAVYRTAIAKLTKQRPAFDCVPPSGDADDRAAAALGNELLKFWWRLLKMPRVLQKSIGWLLTTGNCYYLVSWDPEAGPLTPLTTSVARPVGLNEETGEDEYDEIGDVPADQDGHPILNADGTPNLSAEAHRQAQGEIDIGIIPPSSVRFNPEAESPDDATEWFVGDLLPSVMAEATYKRPKGTFVGVGADSELMTMVDMVTAASAGAGSFMSAIGSNNSTAKGPQSLRLRYYAKPCDDYPDGRHWVSVDGMMVEPEQPLPNGFWPPLVSLQDVPVPTQPIAMGLIGQVMPLNEQYNTLNGKVMENNVTMAMGGKWVLDPADKDLPIDSDPAQKLVSKGYAAGRPPAQIQGKGLPPEVLNERERIISDLQYVASLYEGLGKKPEGVSSGRGFLVLQEQTDSVLGPTLVNIEAALEEIGRRNLVLAQRYYRESRTIKIGGENGIWQWRAFQGSDLAEGLDVVVQVGSSFPWSRAARQDTALSLIQSLPGIVTNPDGTIDMQTLGRLVNVGGLEAFQPTEDPDSDEIEREHAEFEDPQGTLPQVGFWQDHAKHLAGHATFLKRDRARFDRMPKERRDAFFAHWQDTTAALTEALGQMTPPAEQPAPAGMAAGGAEAAPGPPAIAPPGTATSSPDISLTTSDRRSAA